MSSPVGCRPPPLIRDGQLSQMGQLTLASETVRRTSLMVSTSGSVARKPLLCPINGRGSGSFACGEDLCDGMTHHLSAAAPRQPRTRTPEGPRGKVAWDVIKCLLSHATG